ncbi:MAG: hypothetical protein J2P57_04565 [Acidimicrobiaceae bacterium]|nr:hypothetical protein [Acidimicrobiaceae bacterium]
MAAHTTEYNVSSDRGTIRRGDGVVYRKRDVDLRDRRLGGGILPLRARLPRRRAPRRPALRLPAYGSHPDRQHIELLLRGHVVTSILLVILA